MPADFVIEDQLCDSALLILENQTDDTIYFSRGESPGLNRFIKPKETIELTTDYVEVHFSSDCRPTTSFTDIQTIRTAYHAHSIKMHRCKKMRTSIR